jgi:arginine decarboxylase
MAYPPGIPIIYPGEIITKDIILYVTKLKVAKLHILGTEDPELDYIKVIQQ